jgi:hypothetical protein
MVCKLPTNTCYSSWLLNQNLQNILLLEPIAFALSLKLIGNLKSSRSKSEQISNWMK